MTKTIPTSPSGSLKAYGKKIWDRVFQYEHITEEDYDAVLLFCKLFDERKKMEDYLKKFGDLLWINNDTNLVVHPYVKRIAEVDKTVLTLLKELGLTSLSRDTLGLGGEVKDKLGGFLASYHKERK